jgi:hypothetical protein
MQTSGTDWTSMISMMMPMIHADHDVAKLMPKFKRHYRQCPGVLGQKTLKQNFKRNLTMFTQHFRAQIRPSNINTAR